MQKANRIQSSVIENLWLQKTLCSLAFTLRDPVPSNSLFYLQGSMRIGTLLGRRNLPKSREWHLQAGLTFEEESLKDRLKSSKVISPLHLFTLS